MDALAIENVANDVRMASADGPVEREVVDRDIRKRTDDDVLHLPVPTLAGCVKDTVVRFGLGSHLLDDVVKVVKDGFSQFLRGDLRIVTKKEIDDIAVSLLDSQVKKAPGHVILLAVDIGTRILEETFKDILSSFLSRPAGCVLDSFGHRGMRACQHFLQLVHAVLADEMGELLVIVLRLNLAKHDVLVRGAVHGTQDSCDFREIECNELAYELHIGLIHVRTNDCVFL